MPIFARLVLATATVLLLGGSSPRAQAQTVRSLLDAKTEQQGQVFAPGVISSTDSSESSPSITTDGRTVVFTRYASYGRQVPYIATRTGSASTGDASKGDAWTVERAPFAEFVYNLSISPDGSTILFCPPRTGDPATEPVSRVFRVQRAADGTWGDVEEIPELRNTRAGYFDIQPDGTLYLYARPAESGDDPDRPRGVYRAVRQSDGSYSPLIFVGHAVSPAGSNTFAPELFDDGTQMIVTRAGISAEEEAELGEKGFYLHERTEGGWDEGRRLPVPYGWGATLLPDNRLLYVNKGDLYVLAL